MLKPHIISIDLSIDHKNHRSVSLMNTATKDKSCELFGCISD